MAKRHRPGGRRIHFQHHRIYPDCPIERHRCDLQYAADRSRHHDYRVCVDCRAAVTAADAGNEKHRTPKAAARSLCVLYHQPHRFLFRPKFRNPARQPHRHRPDTRRVLVDYRLAGSARCAAGQRQSGFGAAQYGYGHGDGGGHSAWARYRATLKLAVQLFAYRTVRGGGHGHIGEKPAAAAQREHRFAQKPARIA